MSNAALALMLPLLYWAIVLINLLEVKRKGGQRLKLSPTQRQEKPLLLGWYLVVAGLIGQPVVLQFSPEPWIIFRPFAGLDATVLDVVGSVLGLIGLIGTRWCHRAMGKEWKMWIDSGKSGILVSEGPYRWIRHPIYAFQLLISVAVWMLLPTPFLAAVIALHILCIWIKSAGEENHMLRTHGDAYRAYIERTGMFFPKV